MQTEFFKRSFLNSGETEEPLDKNLGIHYNIVYMKITSPAFQSNGMIPLKYTCDGENLNPPLAFSEIPRGAKSLVLVSDDPDAPAGTWVHWIVYNISPETKELKENNLPAGAGQGITSFGKIGYGGPCPPSGTHRYFFKLYALDTVLQFAASPNKADLEEAMSNHILAYAELIGQYSRER